MRRVTRAFFHVTTWMIGTLTLASALPAFAAPPPLITLAALARQEGWHPDAGDPRPNLVPSRSRRER
jgi:hypothetical protein